MSKLILATAVFLFALAMQTSKANSITYDLSTPNSRISGYQESFGSITVTWDNSTMATIAFTAYSPNGYQYLFGGNGAVAVDVNGSYTLGTVTETAVGTGFTPTFRANAPGNEAGFGTFNLSLNNQGGYSDAAGTVSFTITDKSGTWANAASVKAENTLSTQRRKARFPCAFFCAVTPLSGGRDFHQPIQIFKFKILVPSKV